MKSLDPVFKPKSVAVIGATPRKGSIGHEILRNMIMYEYNGKLFPVNPRYEFIHSMKSYLSVLSIPDEVDLAIIVVPKEKVLEIAEECGKKRVKALVVISAGFKEIGGEGIKREQQLAALADKYKFRVVGPNCMGLVTAIEDVRLNATFAPMQPERGVLAMMSQSGALGVAILLATHQLNLGLSYFISVGNKMDVSGNDLLEYWEHDEDTKVIALYLEDFGKPRNFTQLAKRISKKKPIVVVKSGTSVAGASAA
ncbi:MAG: CoA-binding protein, partial [Chitinivibrionia bacterium]|nr:CoA-binding protein [Chitinivibrionia bacterium]